MLDGEVYSLADIKILAEELMISDKIDSTDDTNNDSTDDIKSDTNDDTENSDTNDDTESDTIDDCKL